MSHETIAEKENYSVIVVGAGLSGLQAAQSLRKHFSDIVIVEASDQIGGRVRQVEDVVDWPVQLGPEFIHGAKSSLKRIIEEVGCQTREYDWPDYWYFGEERLLIKDAEEDEDLQRVHKLFAAVGKTVPPRTDISAMQWLKEQGASRRMVAIAEACYANDFGCSLSQLGLCEMIIENQRWDSGDTYLILDRSLSTIVEHLQKGLEGRIRTNWPVSLIEYSNTGALLHGPSGQTLRGRHVIITVPILALQTQSIAFKPALPRDKHAAISRIQMSNAVKVILAFSRPFWPDGFFDVVCTDCFIPEFWVTSYPGSAPAGQALHCMVGFVAGKKAEDMSHMRPSNIITNTLNQLDQMFGCQQRQRPATGAFVRAHVADWSKVPWIGGAYSYPTLGVRPGDRDALARPIGEVLFFAGEATHPAVNPCMQAALETGERAAAQVAAAQDRTCSKL